MEPNRLPVSTGSKMPYYNVWTGDDTKKAVLSSLVPFGAAAGAVTVFYKDSECVKWWEKIEKPKWAPKDLRLYSALDILTLSPLGYASYLVYKNGGGFDYTDTTVAMGLYGANLAFAVATLPIVKKRNHKCLFFNTALVHLTALGAAYAFYQIDKRAGYLVLPYALWTGFYTALTYSINRLNSQNETKSE
ncbi:hypothetical protein QR680_010630 [Steinernema hermaphroditum]|uniref:TspO/MBR family protein n=1 Tax=Steinernema hermaphroditum TaxID=289476 RepID=A0AA39IR60_9BILA|nr:hypothetical protein QR680_010630 [Steinernema hermaphroditum]